MGFSPEVKKDALLRSARHCCVCRLPKVRNLEVHHIVPEADGGPQTIENAVVLCFDCHADAGHYNIRQPRGNKFHPGELRRSRDKWLEMVEENSLATVEDPSLACQYLVVSNKNMCADLLSSNAESLPIAPNTLFYPIRSVQAFQQKEVLRALRGFNLGAEYEQFTEHMRLADYLVARPEAEASASGGAERTFSIEHLSRLGAPQLSFIREMQDLGLSLEVLSWISAHEGGCGDGAIKESWNLPEFCAVWLLVTNVDQQAVIPHSIHGIAEDTGSLFGPRSFALRIAEARDTVRLPPAPLLPNQSIAFPIASAYTEPAGRPLAGDSLFTDQISHGAYQEFAAIGDWPSLTRSWVVGPSWWPLEIEFSRGAATGVAPVHTLEPTSTYTMIQGFEVGSCPHAFVRSSSSTEWEYLRPVLVGAVEDELTDYVSLPEGAIEVCIVELELERTWITRLRVGPAIFYRIALNPGEGIVVDVRGSTEFEVKGQYTPGLAESGAESGADVGPRHFRANPDAFVLKPLS